MVSNHHGSNLKQCGTFYVTKKERRKDLGILSLFFFVVFFNQYKGSRAYPAAQ